MTIPIRYGYKKVRAAKAESDDYEDLSSDGDEVYIVRPKHHGRRRDLWIKKEHLSRKKKVEPELEEEDEDI